MDGEDLGTADHGAVQEEERHLTRPEAVRTVAFWLITIAIANQSLVGTGIVFHIVDIGAEQGLSQAQSVAIFLPVAVTSSIVGLLAGMAVDRLPLRYLIMAMMVGQAVMFAGLGHIADLRIYAITVAGWGLASGFYMPLTVAALPAFFGRLHLGAIQGAQAMCLVVASAIGPSFLALFEAQFGSYRPGLYAACLLPAIVFAAAPFTRDPRRA